MDNSELIQQYLLGTLSADQVAELEERMADSPSLRRQFAMAAAIDAGLRDAAIESSMEPPLPSELKPTSQSWVQQALLSIAIAAGLLLAVGVWLNVRQPSAIASLQTSENAAWESTLPTTVGSRLPPGVMKLATGIATIAFDSGATATLEAPAEFQLLSAVRMSVKRGAAVLDVPESAHGFVVETPGGYAVDHGTQFAVSVNGDSQTSEFEVMQGEISVHHSASGKALRLQNEQMASLSSSELATRDDDPNAEPSESEPTFVRVGTDGRSTYVIRNNRRGKWINPELLMVKQADSRKWDTRAMFRMDLRDIDLSKMQSARLRLNQVPSGKGFASRLPPQNIFAVYGVTVPDRETWGDDPTWEDAPDTDDGVLLGRFEIPRSQTTGTFGIQTPELLDFLRSDQDQKVTFVVVRETRLIEGSDRGLVHAFASDSHPERSGPLLEFAPNQP
ncbi:FecR domain-containing protein [Rhodopirellula sp. JC740]|uniref:FecR domain-containing protein n=1 Tax=Rhodopirellula halodulae TaxID=2894198 RepID=A0ABS8NEU6_9BACT|nr:FecR domain-containing protein [Rhodopirellula sp. JC740]MCC9642079.1 FecR domain-containing protein [Rhodopirellula sp. JC740]